MAHELTYRLLGTSYIEDELQDIIIHISDTDSPVGTPVFTDLILASCSYEVANGDDDPFTMVRASTLSFSFVPTQTYGLSTFKSGEDRRFYVELFFANTSVPIFKGYLLTEETKEELLPKSSDGSWAMFTVQMTAIDNLATLKEILLTKDDETVPRGFVTPIQYLAWILKKTGHALNINIVDSIVSAIDPETEGNWWNNQYLWSKTFEGESTKDGFVCVDCYEALEIMLKGRFICQYGGEWWVIRVDEMVGGAYTIWRYDSDGVYDAVDSNTYEKEIGSEQAIKFLEKNAFVFPSRPHKYDLLDYRFELPAELPDNKEFSRGDLISYDTPTKTGKYEIDDWTLVRVPNSAATTDAYIFREFSDDDQTYEVKKYVVIEADANWHYLRSNPLYLGEKDKCIVSFNRKLTSQYNAGGTTTDLQGQLRLVGNDGTFWTCNGNALLGAVGEWVQCNSTFTTNQRYMVAQYNANQWDETEWQAISLETYAVPVGGELQILLYASSLHATTKDTHLSDLNFEYIPYINNTYPRYSGQYHKVFQGDNYKANLEEVVRVSNSPKRMFKGALHRVSGSGYDVATNAAFWDYRLGILAGLGANSFSKYQAFDYFNQNYDFVNKIQSSFVGLNMATNPSDTPGMIHQYTIDFSTNDDHTANRVFQLVSFKMDLLNQQWEGVLVPTNNTTIGHDFLWDHEFKYRSE